MVEAFPLNGRWKLRIATLSVPVVGLLGLSGVAGADPGVAKIGPTPSGNTSGVRCVQQMLGVNVDGQFGQETYDAVKRFQQSHGLSADGEVGPDTGEALLASHPDPTCYKVVPSRTNFSAQGSSGGSGEVEHPPPPSPMEICNAAFGDLWIPNHDGGCSPDAAIPMGSPPWECVQDQLGKGLIKAVKEAYAEKTAEEVAKVGTKETIKQVAKKVSGPLGIFKCVFVG